MLRSCAVYSETAIYSTRPTQEWSRRRVDITHSAFNENILNLHFLTAGAAIPILSMANSLKSRWSQATVGSTIFLWLWRFRYIHIHEHDSLARRRQWIDYHNKVVLLCILYTGGDATTDVQYVQAYTRWVHIVHKFMLYLYLCLCLCFRSFVVIVRNKMIDDYEWRKSIIGVRWYITGSVRVNHPLTIYTLTQSTRVLCTLLHKCTVYAPAYDITIPACTFALVFSHVHAMHETVLKLRDEGGRVDN